MKLTRIAGIFFLAIITLSWVLAVPTGPSSAITPIGSSRYSSSNSQSTPAIAGNVTEINLDANAVTQTWQGYFGNITGTIVLGNNNNQSMYDWTLAAPQGEVYATSVVSVPAWTNIRCSNTSEIDAEDTTLGINQSRDQDSVNRTFLFDFLHPEFFVGNISITADDCAGVGLYDENGASSTNFREVLLSDGASVPAIYTALITSDSTGFDNRTHDFQMIVGENGHDGDAGTTLYYFYLELE